MEIWKSRENRIYTSFSQERRDYLHATGHMFLGKCQMARTWKQFRASQLKSNFLVAGISDVESLSFITAF